MQIKPASKIWGWESWPADVRPVIRAWNGGPRSKRKEYGDHSLSFRRWMGVFKCTDCSAFCEPHMNGAAVLDGDWLCDDCLIARARATLSELLLGPKVVKNEEKLNEEAT